MNMHFTGITAMVNKRNAGNDSKLIIIKCLYTSVKVGSKIILHI